MKKIIFLLVGSFLLIGYFLNLFHKHHWEYSFGAIIYPDAITIHNGFNANVAIIKVSGELQEPVKLYCNINYERGDTLTVGSLMPPVILSKGKVNFNSGRRDFYGQELNIICVPIDSNAHYGSRLKLNVEIH